MRFNEDLKKEVMGKASPQVRECLKYTIEKMEKESRLNGDFVSIEDFVKRMLKANLDIHAFSVLAEHMPMEFPGNGDTTMLRAVLALMGYDPDYATAPDIEVYPLSYWDNPEELPFN